MALMKSGEASPLRRIEPREYARNVDGLLAQINDPSPAVRRWAARDLATHPQAAAALCGRLAVETDASVRAVLFSSVSTLGGTQVVDGLLPLLRSENPALRNGAIEAPAGLPADVAPRIEQLLRDTDSDVRIFTLNLLGDLPHPDVPQWLSQVLNHEPEANVVGAALEVLAEVGTPDSLGPLRVARERFADDPFITFAADVALERIESP